jgi:DUSAM domain-containing protein
MSEKMAREEMHAAQKEDWEQVRELESQLQRGRPLELTDAVRGLLKRVAVQVALSSADAERGLRSPEEAAVLVGQMRRRIREGSERVGQAMLDAASRAAEGNMRSARLMLKEALAAEVVPYYRESLEALLHELETLRK